MENHLFENLETWGNYQMGWFNHELVSVFQVPDVSDAFFLQDFFSQNLAINSYY